MNGEIYARNLKLAIQDWVATLSEREVMENAELVRRIEKLISTLRQIKD